MTVAAEAMGGLLTAPGCCQRRGFMRYPESGWRLGEKNPTVISNATMVALLPVVKKDDS